MLRGVLVTFHLIGVIASVVLFVSTYSTSSPILNHAKNRVIEATRPHADTSAVVIRKALDQPNLGKWLDGKPRATLEQQLRAYEVSPDLWLRESLEKRAMATSHYDLSEIKNPFARKTMELVHAEWKNTKERMRGTYQNLLNDLRIFSTINAVLFLLSAILCLLRTNERTRFWLLSFSFLMLISLAISINLYIGQNWIWNLILNRYQGWWYSVGVFALFLFLCLHILPQLRSEAPQPALES